MSMNPEKVLQIAHLARIALPESESMDYAEDLTAILNFVEQLESLDTSKISPMAHPLEMHQRLRTDQVSESDQRDAFLKLAPQTDHEYYLVPKVIE